MIRAPRIPFLGLQLYGIMPSFFFYCCCCCSCCCSSFYYWTSQLGHVEQITIANQTLNLKRLKMFSSSVMPFCVSPCRPRSVLLIPRIISFHMNPLGNRMIALLGQELLDSKSLVRSWVRVVCSVWGKERKCPLFGMGPGDLLSYPHICTVNAHTYWAI